MPPKRKSAEKGASKSAVKAPAGKAGKAGKAATASKASAGKAGKSATTSKAPAGKAGKASAGKAGKTPANAKAAPAGKTATASKTSAGKTAAKTSAGKTPAKSAAGKAAAGKVAAGKGGEYTKTARKDKDGRVVYRRAGSSADYVRRKDATGAIVYRASTAARGGAEDDMIGGNLLKKPLGDLGDAFERFTRAVRDRFSRGGLCRNGTTDVNGACILNKETEQVTNREDTYTEETNVHAERSQTNWDLYNNNTDHLGRNIAMKLPPLNVENIAQAFHDVQLLLIPLIIFIKNQEENSIETEERFLKSLAKNNKYFNDKFKGVIEKLELLKDEIRKSLKNDFQLNRYPVLQQPIQGGSAGVFELLKITVEELDEYIKNNNYQNPNQKDIVLIDSFISKFKMVINMSKSSVDLMLDE